MIFDQQLILILSLAALSVVAFFVGLSLPKMGLSKTLNAAQKEADKLVENAQKEAQNVAKELELKAQDEALKLKEQARNETASERQELKVFEQKLEAKADKYQSLLEQFQAQEQEFKQKSADLEEQRMQQLNKERELAELVRKQKQRLESLSGLNPEQAKEMLLGNLQSELKLEQGALIDKVQQEAKEHGDRKAREIIVQAIKRYGSSQVVESTISVVALPNDEMKGRIIGREGRNIRTLEAATGVDFIIDDTPEAVVLSAFDGFRREVARVALTHLIEDGRIHPARIEEVVSKVQAEMEEQLVELGEQLVREVGLVDMHPKLIKHLGRLNYRTSYGQNIWHHSKEVAFLMGAMADELGLDITLAKRCGLLHDLGKALVDEQDKPHALSGAALAEQCSEQDLVVNAIAAHHEDCPAKSDYAHLLCAADAISASRPGARKNAIDEHLGRMEQLEDISNNVFGVQKSLVMQAGREIRVLVRPKQVNDEGAQLIARDIAQKIEAELTYPGQIKITVVRETQSVEYAR